MIPPIAPNMTFAVMLRPLARARIGIEELPSPWAGGVGVPAIDVFRGFVEVFAHLPAHVPERREDDDDGDRDGRDRCEHQ